MRGGFAHLKVCEIVGVDFSKNRILFKIFESEWDRKKRRGNKSTSVYLGMVSNKGIDYRYLGNGHLMHSIDCHVAKGGNPFSTVNR
ncbi:hypothetical protein CU669_16900 [Paramagnetospirillum kuznetsovii]|uniref:Uncharacterized protein n=1 Tax=Paramagnetospirillum kuznetsovii TaxID=2053833 RepID=A0A364NUJ5_9PROT|nr:hypothetical protein [Paramagnetospirillum kuznetsovii]RAU20759.1 hypothetical protein CU669_16900 [Paramagnetospirillum kuznetsovii]